MATILKRKAFVSLPFFNEPQLAFYTAVMEVVGNYFPDLDLYEPKDHQPESDNLTDKIEKISREVAAQFGEMSSKDILIGFDAPEDLGGWVEYLHAFKSGCNNIYVVESSKVKDAKYAAILGTVNKLGTDYTIVANSINLLRDLSIRHDLVLTSESKPIKGEVAIWFKTPNHANTLLTELPSSKMKLGELSKDDFLVILASLVVSGAKKDLVTRLVESTGKPIPPVIRGLLNSID